MQVTSGLRGGGGPATSPRGSGGGGGGGVGGGGGGGGGSYTGEDRRMADVTKDKAIKVTVRVLVPVREHPRVSTASIIYYKKIFIPIVL